MDKDKLFATHLVYKVDGTIMNDHLPVFAEFSCGHARVALVVKVTLLRVGEQTVRLGAIEFELRTSELEV